MTRLVPVVLSGLLVAACASMSEPAVETTFNEEANRTVYRTRSIFIRDLSHTSDLRPTRWVHLQVRGTCPGAACKPESFLLRFLIESNTPSRRYGEALVLKTESETFEWKREHMLSEYEKTRRPVAATPEVLAEVPVPLSTLQTLSNADPLRGALGSRSFTLSHEDLSPLRRFVERVVGADSTG